MSHVRNTISVVICASFLADCSSPPEVQTSKSAQATCFLFPLGVGPENVCYEGVFPANPIFVELGQAVPIPDFTYSNNTNRPMTFTIEAVGDIDFPGPQALHSVT